MARNARIPPTEPYEPQPGGTHAASASLMLEVSKIQPYERNPRHGRNPEYDRIKDSIRSQGLDQPLVITQRPGATDYIVHAGGNTRLLILKELFEETGDTRFSLVSCLFRPWRRESDVLLAHLRENDLRGNLTFIDKARAVLDAKQLIAEDLEVKEVSLRRLETELGKAGYRITNSVICLMVYAVETLLELIPQALEAGIGRHQIGRIRVLERAATKLWQRYAAGDESAFDEVFVALCRRYDGPEWDTDLLQSAIETEIAEETETSIHTIRVALEAEINGRELSIPEFVPIKEPPRPERQGDGDRNPVTLEGRDDPEAGDTGSNPASEAPVTPTDASIQPQDHLDDSTDLDGSADDAPEPLGDDGHYKPTDLKSLRGRAWTLATRLAQRNGIGDLVVPLSGKGLGYVLSDVPDHSLADQLDEESLAQVCMLWWQLAACAEMTYAPLVSIIPVLPADSVLRRALEEEDGELLFSSIWTLDPGHTGYRLWRSLPDRDWRDLLTLMETYRQIRHLAAETGTALWD
jgi:ParB family protein of integrating conjugative element (PFGI_1 class)